jgi:hypothetical protein
VHGIEYEELKLRYNGRLGSLMFVLFYESYYFVYLSCLKKSMKETERTVYQPFLMEILGKIKQARYEMLKTVSRQTVMLYWEIGKSVSEKVLSEKWGKSVVEQLSKDLQAEFSGIRGFSARNIWRMKSFL